MANIFSFAEAPEFHIGSHAEYAAHMERIVAYWRGEDIGPDYNVIAWKYAVMSYEENHGMESRCARLCDEAVGIGLPV
jgi:hypothetical protein